MLYSVCSFHGNHKWFLVVLSAVVILAVVGLLALMWSGTIGEFSETVNMLTYLYHIIYPYQLSLNLVELLGMQVLFGVSVLIILLFAFGFLIHQNEFRLAISSSYLLLFFTSFFLIVNIFFYLIPPLRDFILTDPILQWIILFFYGILPYITLTLSLLFLCFCWDVREKVKQTRDSATINRRLGKPWIGTLTKYLTFGALLVLLVVGIAVFAQF